MISQYSKTRQWDAFEKDMMELENDEELLFKLGDRYYVAYVAKDKDLINHQKEVTHADNPSEPIPTDTE